MEKKDVFLKELILNINSSKLNTVKNNLVSKTFELSPHSFLLTDLSGWIGALIVKALCHELGINEHHIFKWRPENKYIQYLILNHYAPGCIPRTLSLTAILKKEDWVANIRQLVKSGYFIKATLGHGSGGTNSFDKTTDFEKILLNHKNVDSFENEKWIIQKRLNLNKEFRIHTFGKDILYGLTLRIGGDNEINVFDRPQEFIDSILKKLPYSFLEGTLIGWDVGLTARGKLYVIEANFTGFHPIFQTGFQTTGYVDNPPLGSIICALLYTYFRNKYGISITAVESTLMETFPYLEEFSYYISILNDEHIQSIFQAKGRVKVVYIYLDEKTEFHIIQLIDYMQLANFAETFYIVTNRELQEGAKEQFKGNRIIHLAEHTLFTEDQYKEVQQLDDECKKNRCRSQIMKLINEQSYIII
ncbi:hypothetical protein [Pedobacter cryoconitis]|uniref:ATP-grasp domain-containing protein n=1 Tax=Pedobacter cryoconitis TaxID=188932 RepID=A0A327SIV4_9SPHI|nr:hypothetical protein [Pedobacter cryoconitis]RAJ29090.1 hypothetical protein LY11_02982 [Pedobacter cryoconitis]